MSDDPVSHVLAAQSELSFGAGVLAASLSSSPVMASMWIV